MNDVVMVSLVHGPWRGDALALDAELGRRKGAGAALEVCLAVVRTSEEAATFVDELGCRLLSGSCWVAPCQHELDADLVEFHAKLYAERPAH